MSIKHAKVLAKADGADATLARPVDWNADHQIVFTTIDISIATRALYSGTFDITTLSGLTANNPVFIQQAAGPYSGKGTRQDEAEMDGIDISAYIVDATTIRCYWNANPGPVVGNFKFVLYPGA